MTARTGRDLTAELAYLTRALKAPTLRGAVDRLAERARAESWTTRSSSSAVCNAKSPPATATAAKDASAPPGSRPAKSLEEFDYDHARGLKRDLIAHLGTLDFVTAKDNVLLLGPPGTGKTHLATGLAIRACQAGHGVLFATAAQWVTASPTPTPAAGCKTSSPARPLPAARRRRGRLHPVRARSRQPVLPTRLQPLRARQPRRHQ